MSQLGEFVAVCRHLVMAFVAISSKAFKVFVQQRRLILVLAENGHRTVRVRDLELRGNLNQSDHFSKFEWNQCWFELSLIGPGGGRITEPCWSVLGMDSLCEWS